MGRKAGGKNSVISKGELKKKIKELEENATANKNTSTDGVSDKSKNPVLDSNNIHTDTIEIEPPEKKKSSDVYICGNCQKHLSYEAPQCAYCGVQLSWR